MAKRQRRIGLGLQEPEHALRGRNGLRMARDEYERAERGESCRTTISRLAYARELVVSSEDDLLYGDDIKNYKLASDLHQRIREDFHRALGRCLKPERK